MRVDPFKKIEFLKGHIKFEDLGSSVNGGESLQGIRM